ncbi:helix-turn-helix transcriptional regulator [Kineosporia babensis]
MSRGLQKARKESGLTWEEIRASGLPSRTTIQRWENGDGIPTLPELKFAALDVYKVDERKFEDFKLWLREGDGPTTWEENGKGLPDIPGFRTLIDLEDVCDTYRMWAPVVIPGPLQIEPYMHAMFAVSPTLTLSDAKAMATIRMERQAKLVGDVAITAVLAEEVLMRHIGGDDVMQEQVQYLRRLTAERLADIRVLPLSGGAHCGTLGEFYLLDFPLDTEEPPTMYCDGWIVSHYTSDDKKLASFESRFAELEAQSVPLEDFLT